MKKISLLMIALAIFASQTACGRSYSDASTPETTLTETVTETGAETVTETVTETTTVKSNGASTKKPSENTVSNITETDVHVNTELISYVGQPFSYFSEKFGWKLEDLDIVSEGPPVGYYTYNDIKFTFNNRLGYDDLNAETPCTGITTLYTTLLSGVGTEKLTEQNLTEIFGEYSDEYLSYGILDVYYQDDIVIRFHVNETGQLEDYVNIDLCSK